MGAAMRKYNHIQFTFLSVLVRKKKVNDVQKLLNTTPIPIDVNQNVWLGNPERVSKTLLEMAIKNKDSDMVKVLIAHGAKVSVLENALRDEVLQTPIVENKDDYIAWIQHQYFFEMVQQEESLNKNWKVGHNKGAAQLKSYYFLMDRLKQYPSMPEKIKIKYNEYINYLYMQLATECVKQAYSGNNIAISINQYKRQIASQLVQKKQKTNLNRFFESDDFVGFVRTLQEHVIKVLVKKTIENVKFFQCDKIQWVTFIESSIHVLLTLLPKDNHNLMLEKFMQSLLEDKNLLRYFLINPASQVMDLLQIEPWCEKIIAEKIEDEVNQRFEKINRDCKCLKEKVTRILKLLGKNNQGCSFKKLSDLWWCKLELSMIKNEIINLVDTINQQNAPELNAVLLLIRKNVSLAVLQTEMMIEIQKKLEELNALTRLPSYHPKRLFLRKNSIDKKKKAFIKARRWCCGPNPDWGKILAFARAAANSPTGIGRGRFVTSKTGRQFTALQERYFTVLKQRSVKESKSVETKVENDDLRSSSVSVDRSHSDRFKVRRSSSEDRVDVSQQMPDDGAPITTAFLHGDSIRHYIPVQSNPMGSASGMNKEDLLVQPPKSKRAENRSSIFSSPDAPTTSENRVDASQQMPDGGKPITRAFLHGGSIRNDVQVQSKQLSSESGINKGALPVQPPQLNLAENRYSFLSSLPCAPTTPLRGQDISESKSNNLQQPLAC